MSLGQGPGTAPGMGRSNSLSDVPRASMDGEQPPQRPINTFLRRPTNLSEKEIRRAAARGGAPEEEGEDAREAGHIDLEGGLDISLNMEVDQMDPSGTTQPYRLLVPALWYEGKADVNTAPFKSSRGASLVNRFRLRGKKDAEEDEYSDDETATPPPSRGQAHQSGTASNQPAVAGARGMPPQQPPGYGNDGPYETARNGVPPRRAGEPPVDTYGKGYNLTAPPMGASTQEPRSTNTANNPYPSQSGSNYRRASAPVSQKHSEQVPGPYGRAQDEYSEGSLTPSDDLEEGPPGRTPGVQPRRLSKAERFFGIGDDGGRAGAPMQDEGAYVDGRQEKTKPKWMIWK